MKKILLAILLIPSLLGMVNAQGLASVDSIQGIQQGSILVLTLTGNANGGSVWGSEIYTTDSNLAAAAVHAGLIPDGSAGPVLVHVLPGQGSYAGSARNGVTSAPYGSYGLSYSLSEAR